MTNIKLKTSFDFDAAHRLVGYEGKCNNLHGHIWHVDIEIYGRRQNLDKNGIMWDFTNVKELKDMFDHKTILKDCEGNYKLRLLLLEEKNEVYTMKENPTAENLCWEILLYLKDKNHKLKYKVTVWESPKSYSEMEG